MLLRLLPLLCCVIATVLATEPYSDFEGRVVANATLDVHAFAAITSLDEEFYLTVPIVANQSFQFHEIPDGQYILEIHDFDYSFPTHEVSLRAGEPARLYYHIPGHRRGPAQPPLRVPHPFEIETLGKYSDLNAKKPFSIYDWLMSNPILLLTVLCIGLATGLPKLLGILDPETLKEVRQNQSDMHQRMANMQNVDLTSGLSKFLASTGERDKPQQAQGEQKKASSATTTATSTSTGQQGNHKKGKRRK